MIEFSPAVSGDGSLCVNRLTPTTIWSPRSIASRRLVFELDELAFHIARGDRLHRAPHRVDGAKFGERLPLERGDQGVDLPAAFENIIKFKKISLISHDLL